MKGEAVKNRTFFVLIFCSDFCIPTSAFCLLASSYSYFFHSHFGRYLTSKHPRTLPCPSTMEDYTDPGRNLDVCAYLSHAGAAACS